MGRASTLLFSLSLLVGLSLAPTSASAYAETPNARYEVVDLGSLGGNASFALDLNDRNQITGNSRTGTSTLPLLAFVWDGGEMTNLGSLPDSNAFSRGYAINNQGVVVGESDNNRPRAFRWEAGHLTDLGDLGGGSAVAHGINQAGLIVGASSNGLATRPFVWWRGTMRDLGTAAGGDSTPGRAWDVNNRGDIVGNSRTAEGVTQATLWPGANRAGLGVPVVLGSLGDGLRFSEAFAVNQHRWAAGRSIVTGSTERAFLWHPETGMTDLGSLGLNHSRALDVNQRGHVVGYASQFAGFATFGTAAAFLWEDDTLHDLNDLIDPNSGWQLLVAEAINARGAITGYGRHDGQIRSFLLLPTGR